MNLATAPAHSATSSAKTTIKTSGVVSQTTEDDAPKLLDSVTGLRERITPVGRKVFLVKKNALWAFRLDGQGGQPDETLMWYTSMHLAERAMDNYLKRFWNQSDSKKSK